MKKTALILLVALLAPVEHAATSTAAGDPPKQRRAGRAPLAARHARGHVIVKYRNSVNSCVHCLLQRQQGFVGAVRKGGDRLEALHQHLGAVSARPLFRTSEEERRVQREEGGVPVGELRRLHRKRLTAIRTAFPVRSRRGTSAAKIPELHHVYVLEIADRFDAMEAARQLQRNRHVAYAHPDYIYRNDAIPNDPFFRSSGSWGQEYDDLWGLKGDQLDVASAWDRTQGDGVIVAVVDSGVDYRHEDLAPNIWRNSREIAGNGVDDDRNGFVDDELGWDFVNDDSDPMDDNKHGTHVSGTIAAVGDNGRGIVGVAPRARILPVKSFNSRGSGRTSDIAPGLVYAAANGADVINNSWGCSFCPRVRSHEDAVKAASGMGAVVVFSAGNSARSNRWVSPHNLRDPKPIVVAASHPGDQATYFSNLGTAVDVAAPGGGVDHTDNAILSLRYRGRCQGCRKLTLNKKYMRLQGTSMAAPHVSGLAALLLSDKPQLKADEVRQVIRSTSDDLGPAGHDLRTGTGRIDATRALRSEPPLEVRISRPADSTKVTKSVLRVRGTAAGPGFDRYQLFQKPEGALDWRPLTEPAASPVRGQVLAELSRQSLSVGWNLLRLVATTHDGRTFEDVVSVARQPIPRRIGEALAGAAAEPSISGDRITWIQLQKPFRKQLGHVYVYDTVTGGLARLSETPARLSRPSISGDTVVWDSSPRGNRDPEVFVCTLTAAADGCRTTLSGRSVDGPIRLGPGLQPVVSGDLVVMSDSHQLVVTDLATGLTRTLGRVGINSHATDGRRIAWFGRDRGDDHESLHLFDWDTSETRKVQLDRDFHYSGVAVAGTSVFYRALPRGAYDGQDLRRYDLLSDTSSVLIDELFPSTSDFRVSGTRLVWTQASDVQSYDLVSGQRGALVVHPLDFRVSADISGDGLVWIEPDLTSLRRTGVAAGELHFARLPAGTGE